MTGTSSASHGTEPPRFLSLGMVVLDELHFTDRESLYNIAGGSGAYGILAFLGLAIGWFADGKHILKPRLALACSPAQLALSQWRG